MYLFEQMVGKKTKVERIINWIFPETEGEKKKSLKTKMATSALEAA